MSGTRFDDFIAPARERPQLWRTALGVLMACGLFVISVLSLMAIIWFMVGPSNAQVWFERMRSASTPTGALLMLYSFAGLAFGIASATRLLHRRKARTLFGPTARLMRDFAIAAGVVFFLYGLSLVAWSQNYDALMNLDYSLWLTFLPLALLGILVQTGTEELAFRGYLQQQLAVRFRSPVIWMAVPSVLFGALHFDPTNAGPNTWAIVGTATLFAFVAADLTARTGSLGAAWGFHFANNCLAILFLATDGTITGLSLYITPYSASDPSLPRVLILTDIAMMGLAWMICRRLLRK